MAPLPATRNVYVTVTRNDNFVARDGFGTPLFLTSQTIAGKLDADNRTRAYASIDEVSAEFNGGDPFYEAAQQAFSQNPSPLLIKAGWYDATVATDAQGLTDELDAIADFDDAWYWIDVEASLRDTAALDGLVNWAEARDKQATITSNDANIEQLSDTTNIAARHKGQIEHSSVFYSTDADEYLGFATGSYFGTFNFDDRDTAYTAKYKRFRTFAPLNRPSSVANIVQGWVPEIGQSLQAGHCANCIVDQGGRFILEQGSVLTPNVFIDEIHFTHWLKARTTERILNLLMNNNRVPYDDRGFQMIAGQIEAQLVQAFNAGLLAADETDEDGNYVPSFVVNVPRYSAVPASQRKARVAPAFGASFRYAGAVHFGRINYTVNF